YVEVACVCTLHFHIDRRGKTEIENLRHHVRRFKIERHGRKGSRQHPAQRLNVFLRRAMMLLIQRHENLAIEGADIRGETEGEVDWVLRKADIIENKIELVSGNN